MSKTEEPEWGEMKCVDCGKKYEGEIIPGPYKRCPKCRFEFKKKWDKLSPEEKNKRTIEALKAIKPIAKQKEKEDADKNTVL